MAGEPSTNSTQTQPLYPHNPAYYQPQAIPIAYQLQSQPQQVQVQYQVATLDNTGAVFTVPKGKGFSFKSGHCCEKENHTVEVTDTHVYLRKEDNGCVPKSSYSAIHVKDISTVEYNSRPYSLVAAYILWLFFGFLGAHRFYVGKWRTGLVWLFTGGVFGLGWLFDAFLIPSWMKRANLSLTVCGHYNKNLHIAVDSTIASQIEEAITESQRKLYYQNQN